MQRRVAIVTGGANGIGKEIVKKFLASDFYVAVYDLYEGKPDNELLANDKYLMLKVDVTQEQAVMEATVKVIKQFGKIAVLVNNAGGSKAIAKALETISTTEWDSVVNLNLRSTFICSKAVIPSMKEANWGRIVNISSMAGRGRSVFGGTPYSAAKAGILGFTRQASRELGSFNITINAIAPGTILSGERINDYWQNKKTEEERSSFCKMTPLGRPGTPEDVVEAVWFLSSEGAAYITGAVLDINGGYWVG